MPREPMSDIIVLLPGIMGSVLQRGDKVVWGLSAGLMGSALFSLGGSVRKDLTLHDNSPDPNVLADGIAATNPTSRPNAIDFGCGVHSSWPSGTCNRARRVRSPVPLCR